MNIHLCSFAAHSSYGKHACVLIMAALVMRYPVTFSALVSRPMNTVSIVGSRTKIECSRNAHELYPVDWEFASIGSSEFSYIYTSRRPTGNLSSRYKIDTDNKTRYDIVIDSIDWYLAGTYRCTPIAEETRSASAELVVLASEPKCNTNASNIEEHGYIRMFCTVIYNGNWIPVMECIRDKGQTVDSDSIYDNTSSSVTSSLIIQLNSSDNGVSFACKTTFKQNSTKIDKTGTGGETHATNVPQYEYLWNFTPNVLYAPRDVTITPFSNDYRVGDRLVCSANGNPNPTYEWMDVETNRTIDGSVLTIEEIMVSDKNHSFRCTAFNTVASSRRQAYHTITFTVTSGRVTFTEGSGFTTGQNIIISVIIVGAICSLVLILYLCNNRCHFKRARLEPDILQALQLNHYGSHEDHQTDRLHSVQAVHPPGAQGGNLQQPLPPPVYAEVRRKENNDEVHLGHEGATGYLPRHQGVPVYSEVVKNRNGSKNSNGTSQTNETTASQCRFSPTTLTGADGTQYMEVTSIRDPKARAPIKQPPMFSQVETYASIDHTVAAPPPLPPKRQ